MRKHIPEFSKKREVILFIFDYSCVVCGLVSTSNHVHHVNFNPLDNHVCNLAPVCDYCHKLIHKTRSWILVKKTETQVQMLDKLQKAV